VPGTAERLRSGEHGAVLALGAMVENALLAAGELAREGIELEIWDFRFCRPLDQGALAEVARRHAFLATVEEHALNGGFGSAVLETLSDLGLERPVLRHGVGDRFVEHASSREEQLREVGLDPGSLAAAWREALADRERQPVA